jgi:diphthine synthase
MTKGTLRFIGLGLYDEKDISLKGLEEVKNCDKVFAEFYTAKLAGTNLQKLEKILGKKILLLSRKDVEKGDGIIKFAAKEDVALLVPGDPMSATTHVDLRIRAIDKGIDTKLIHGSSIITAVAGLLGLQIYKFGRTTTLAFPEKNYFPTSPYDVIKENKAIGLHTLILLDIQQDKELYMNANKAISLLLDIENIRNENIITNETVICVVGRAGSLLPIVVSNTIEELINRDLGPPLHSLVIPGKLHFMEIEALEKLAGLPTDIGKKLQKL